MLNLRTFFLISLLLTTLGFIASDPPSGSNVASDEEANPYTCAIRIAQQYDVNLRVTHEAIEITILEKGKKHAPLFIFKGHQCTVFTANKDTLAYVNYDIKHEGGEVIGVDLKTGKVRWTTKLQNVMPRSHSAYANIINIDDKHLNGIRVRGKDSNGSFVEILDWKTGAKISFQEL